MIADSNWCMPLSRRKLDRLVSPCWCLAILIPLSVPLFGSPSPVKLRYQFTPRLQDGQLILHVVIDMEGIAPAGTELVLPSSWGNAIRLTRAVRNVRTESPGASIIDTGDSSRKLLRGIARGRARISYDLVNDWDGPLRESVRHRAHLDPAFRR